MEAMAATAMSISASLDVGAFPNYAAHYERMLKRPAVQKMLDVEARAQADIDGPA